MSKDWTQEKAIEIMEAEITALRAENERLRAALAWIDSQRYEGRGTINNDNAFEYAGRLNEKIVFIMDRARAALEKK